MSKWRRTLARWLRSLAAWIDVPLIIDGLALRTRVLVLEQETRWPDRDGEAKRHQVLSRLVKDFPGTPKRVLAAAIETAVEDV